MLELRRQLVVKLIELPLRREFLDGGVDKALGDLKRRLDLDTRRGAGVEDRHRDGGECGEEVDQPYRNEKLGADWPIIPEFLQH
jgi:hypothetical protein